MTTSHYRNQTMAQFTDAYMRQSAPESASTN